MKHFGDCQAYTIIIFFKIKTWTVFCGEKKLCICEFYSSMTVFQARFWLNTKIVAAGDTKQKLDTEDKDKQVPVLNSGMWVFFIRNIFY